MSRLAEKMRRAREVRVELEPGKVVIARRPTDIEWAELPSWTAKDVIRCVVGWSGIVESDLVAGGDPHPVEFDAEACAEWLADDPKAFGAVVTAVIDAYKAHAASLEEAAKN